MGNVVFREDDDVVAGFPFSDMQFGVAHCPSEAESLGGRSPHSGPGEAWIDAKVSEVEHPKDIKFADVSDGYEGWRDEPASDDIAGDV